MRLACRCLKAALPAEHLFVPGRNATKSFQILSNCRTLAPLRNGETNYVHRRLVLMICLMRNWSCAGEFA